MKKMNLNIKNSMSARSVRYGSFSAATTAVLIAIVVVVNLLMSQIPSSLTEFDMSADRIYTIGSKTEEVLEGLDEDVTISVLQTRDHSLEQLNKLLESYSEASGHIEVKYVDPNVDIEAAQKYSGLTLNSLVVTCGEREKTIDYNNIFVTDYQSYDAGGQADTSFNGENLITGAIAYVTTGNLPVMYRVTGHGEAAVSATVSDQIARQNISLKDLNLLTTDIPEDCAALLICAPVTDYTSDEAEKVTDYLDGGGKALVMTTYTAESMTNFRSILKGYGIRYEEGIVMEGADHYYQEPLYAVATIDESETGITDSLAAEDANILMVQAEAFSDGRSDVSDGEKLSYMPLLSTSDDSYLKKVVNGSLPAYEKESGDAEGPFQLAVLAMKNSAGADEKEESGDSDPAGDQSSGKSAEPGEIIAISTAALVDDSITAMVPANLEFFGNCLGYLCGGEDSAAISIDGKSMNDSYVVATTVQATVIAAACIIVIPLAILVAGLVIWFNRRRK